MTLKTITLKEYCEQLGNYEVAKRIEALNNKEKGYMLIARNIYRAIEVNLPVFCVVDKNNNLKECYLKRGWK